MIAAETIAAALAADQPRVVEAVGRAERALAAWSALPPCVRRAYPGEARRLARRAAVALVALLEVTRSPADASH